MRLWPFIFGRLEARPRVSEVLKAFSIQKCKTYIVDHIAPSAARTTALRNYCLELSKSEEDKQDQRPSAKRRRLHILYVINDVLYHVSVRLKDTTFGTAWDDVLPALVASAAEFDKSTKHKKKLKELVNLWEDQGYFTSLLISQLREAVANGSAAIINAQPASTSAKPTKDIPYVLPSIHGDPSAAWYDLPASTWMQHIVPNSTKPMLPNLIRPVQLAAGPADKALAAAVKKLISDADHMFSRTRKGSDDPNADMNELGESLVLDEMTGDIIGGDTYYGWSRTFCDNMKQLKKNGPGGPRRDRSRTRSSISSRSRSRSSSPRGLKRRRLSPDSSDRSRSRGRKGDSSRRRSYSPSRSRSPPRRPLSQHPGPPPHPSFNQAFAPPAPPLPGNFPMPMPPPPPPPHGFQGSWPPPPPPNWHPNPGAMPPQMPGWAPPAPPHMHQQDQQYRVNDMRGRGTYRGRGRGTFDRGRPW